MLRRSPIYVALTPDVVSSGLQPDKHRLHRKLWDTAENVTFFAGKIRRRLPPSLMLDVGDDPIRGINQQQGTDGTRWLWAASGGTVKRWYGPAAETIWDTTWDEDQTVTHLPTFFDFTHYGDWTIINKGEGAAQIFKPDTGLEVYGNAPEDVVKFMKKMSFVMAFGYGARGTRVGWSDSADIEEWTASAENSAGSISIDDFDTRIMTANPLGQAIAVFSEDQMALVSYISAPFYFGQKMVLDGIGAVSKNSVASDGKNCVGVGFGGIWWTDSLSYRYIDEGYLHDYLQEEVNWDQAAKIQAMRNDFTGCFEFYFPMRDSLVVDEGWSFDPRTGGYSKLGGLSMKDERRIFRKPLVGTNDGLIQFDQNDPEAAAALVLETKPLLMMVQSAEGYVDSHTTARVDEVDLLIKTASNVEFRIKSSQEMHQDFEASPWLEVASEARTYKVPALPDGVYWKLEFRSTADNWDLDMQGFMLFGAVEGTKRTNQ